MDNPTNLSVILNIACEITNCTPRMLCSDIPRDWFNSCYARYIYILLAVENGTSAEDASVFMGSTKSMGRRYLARARDKALWDDQFYKLLTKARDTYAKRH